MLEGCSQFNGTRRYFITAFILQCSDSNVILLKQSHNLLLPTSNKDSALTILMLTLLWYICLIWLARVSLLLFMPKLFLKSRLIFSDLQARMRVQSAMTAILASSLSVWWGSFWKKKWGYSQPWLKSLNTRKTFTLHCKWRLLRLIPYDSVFSIADIYNSK